MSAPKYPHEKMAVLPTMGGQTALNTALALEANGTLAKYDVEMIGATAEAIDKAERPPSSSATRWTASAWNPRGRGLPIRSKRR
jgi:hypothetical protein